LPMSIRRRDFLSSFGAASFAAALPLTKGEMDALAAPPQAASPSPTTTANAIYSGALQAICGAVERMELALTSSGQVRIVMSGGAAEVIAARLGRPVATAADLVLDGLVAIARA